MADLVAVCREPEIRNMLADRTRETALLAVVPGEQRTFMLRELPADGGADFAWVRTS